jgi:hypothetical protein
VLYHLSHASSPFDFSYFSNKVLCLSSDGLNGNPPIYASHAAGMTGMNHCAKLLLVEMKSLELFSWTNFELQSF